MNPEHLASVPVLLVTAAPLAAFWLIGVWSFVLRTPDEPTVTRIARAALTVSWIAAIATAFGVLASGHVPGAVATFEWFRSGDYIFRYGVLVDPLSAAMLVLSTTIIGIIGRFASVYLHREPGFARFFLLLLLFAAGMTSLISSPSFEQLFIGWEVVGITSVLLVGFFYERDTPVKASLRVFATYRFGDVGLLLGGVVLHRALHDMDATILFSGVDPDSTWPNGRFDLATGEADTVALLFLLACLGKSALFPLGGWLGRAMEGPTPSSAVFYGALSVHAGVYLMLRSAPILEDAAVAPWVIGLVGAITAVWAYLITRVQTDVKSVLAFSTMTQVGLMYIWIGAGWYQLAAIHLMGHAVLRAWQLLRSPSALSDAAEIQAALGGRPLHDADWLSGWLSEPARARLYALSVERFRVDAALEHGFVRPVLEAGRRFQRVEHAWAALVSGWGPAAFQRANLERTDRARRLP
jgi:NADH-quinone oxidoreductase subunit L